MSLLIMSFIAGTLTVLAPCVFPILPVIVGGSVVNGKKSNPRVIIASFAISILLFTLLLQWLVNQFDISQQMLTKVSAVILIVFGILLLFPNLRQKLMHVTKMEAATNNAANTSHSGIKGDIILGATLGPIFNTCSPTYAILIATILPASFLRGLVNIIAYIAGLSLVLGIIAYSGRWFVQKMKWASSPNGLFKKIIALLLIFMGLAIFMKRDKAAESRMIEKGLVIDTTMREVNKIKDFK